MSLLLKTIADWKKGKIENDDEKNAVEENSEKEKKELNFSFRELFKDVLHNAPYHLRYSTDNHRPHLFMIHPTDLSDKSEELVRECNGIILNCNTFEIVAYGMRTLNDYEQSVDNMNLEELEKYNIEEAEDGTVLKVFYHDVEWIVSTNRRIDASRVRWSSRKSFKQMLCEALSTTNPDELFEKDLKKDLTYSFILLHPDNRLVIKHENPELVFVSSRNNVSLEEISPENAMSWARLPRKLTPEECIKNINSKDAKDKRGVILTLENSDPKNINRRKIDYQWFSKGSGLRKNMPDFYLSYLSCNHQEKKEMREYFGSDEENKKMFNNVDISLRNLGNHIFELYRDSYVRKQFKIPNNHPLFNILRKLHNVYRDNVAKSNEIANGKDENGDNEKQKNMKNYPEPIRMKHIRQVLDDVTAYELHAIFCSSEPSNSIIA